MNRNVIFIIISIFLMAFSQPLLAGEIIADENLEEMPLAQRMKYLGLIIPEEVKERFAELDKLPPPELLDTQDYFDWRTMGGVTPVKDQANCGSCWDFAAVGAVESALLISDGIEWDLSEQQGLSCNTGGSSCGGGWMEDVYDLFTSFGAVEESCMPYQADDGVPCTQDQCEVVSMIEGYIDIPNNVNSIKNALQTGPVSTTLSIPDGFHWDCFEGVWSNADHAVVIVGWDDAMCGGQGAWIVKNSWSTGHGDNGYDYIPYGSCGIGHYTQQPVYSGYLSFTFPDGLPEYVNPYGGTVVRVNVGQYGIPGTGVFHYNYGTGWNQQNMSTQYPNQYRAVFPAIPCGSNVEYYFSAQRQGGTTINNPASAPAFCYYTLSGVGFVSIFEDNFETDQGWTVENLGASSGDWQRGVPVNDSGWDYDPASDADGSGRCYLTQNETGNTDVDGGAVRLTAPVFDMTGGGTISYDYYLYLTDADGSDMLLVEMDDNGGSGPWVEVDRHDTNGSTSWRNNIITEADITSAGLGFTANMRIRFTANDADAQSIVEAGIDGFTVNSVDCGGPLPDVSIDMRPDNDPVYTTQGGSFDFTGVLKNNTDEQQYTDVWIMLVLPNSNWYGPINQWNNIPLAPNDSLVDPNARQYIPGYAPVGEYEYWAYCGDYPSTKIDSASFSFFIFPGLIRQAYDWKMSKWFGESENIIPLLTELYDNYPNPFNATTTLSYSLAENSEVKLEVFNILGQKVSTVVDEYQNAGFKTVNWNASSVSSGLYFYKLTTDNKQLTKRLTIIK